MNLDAISYGDKAPEEVNVVIEVPIGGEPIKYEMDKASGALFESFYTTKDSGMGMGLSICKSIVEAHGGHIEADAHRQSGACFRFCIPQPRDCDMNPGLR